MLRSSSHRNLTRSNAARLFSSEIASIKLLPLRSVSVKALRLSDPQRLTEEVPGNRLRPPWASRAEVPSPARRLNNAGTLKPAGNFHMPKTFPSLRRGYFLGTRNDTDTSAIHGKALEAPKLALSGARVLQGIAARASLLLRGMQQRGRSTRDTNLA